jgi:hypothetical protein
MANSTDTNLRVDSIEWVNPENFDDTCRISLGRDGVRFIDWKCHDVNHQHIKYFSGLPFKDIYIAPNGVTSGSIIIIVR